MTWGEGVQAGCGPLWPLEGQLQTGPGPCVEAALGQQLPGSGWLGPSRREREAPSQALAWRAAGPGYASSCRPARDT